jgi:predicted unusual protein kinase regulating ubiquinone biosynthesis (AarF/ABC1/UbiB family)
MLLVDNFLHGDLHCKNWKVRVNDAGKPQIVVYDCGICFSNINLQLTRDFWFAIGKYDVEKMTDVLNRFLIINNQNHIDINLEEEIRNIFNIILKNSVGIGMVMKSIIHFFQNHNIIIHKFLLNFSILMCLIEDFLKNNDVINRERNINNVDYNSNMYEIINENQLDIITYCNVRNCYPEVGKLLLAELNTKHAEYKNNKSSFFSDDTPSNTDIPTNTQLFSNIKLSGLTFKPPE